MARVVQWDRVLCHHWIRRNSHRNPPRRHSSGAIPLTCSCTRSGSCTPLNWPGSWFRALPSIICPLPGSSNWCSLCLVPRAIIYYKPVHDCARRRLAGVASTSSYGARCGRCVVDNGTACCPLPTAMQMILLAFIHGAQFRVNLLHNYGRVQ